MNAPTTIEQIEQGCKTYAEARAELRSAMTALQDEVRAINEKHRPAILAAIDLAVNARLALLVQVESGAALFTKPRTRQLHSIKVGFRKLPGRVEFAESEERTIELIRKKLPDLEADLVQIKASVRKANAAALDAKQLAAIGCSLLDAGDEVVVAATDTDIDRLISAMASDASMGPDVLQKAGAI
jgi:hypothetical protein